MKFPRRHLSGRVTVRSRIFDHAVIDCDRGNLVIHWRNGAKTRLEYAKPLKKRRKAA